jgi:hypothetical protein
VGVFFAVDGYGKIERLDRRALSAQYDYPIEREQQKMR